VNNATNEKVKVLLHNFKPCILHLLPKSVKFQSI